MAYQELSGFAQAAETNQRYAAMEQQRLAQLSQDQFRQEQIGLERQKFEMAKRAKEKEDYEKWEREQILNSVADSRYKDMVASGEISSSQMLADQAKKAAAEAMRRGQSKYSTDFLDIASKYETQAKNYQSAQQTLQDKKQEDAREVLGTVNDPVSWAYAKPKLAEAGIEVPSQLQSWSPDTAKWVDNEARKGKAVQAAERLNIAAEKAQAQAESAKAKLELEQQKQQSKRTDEALKRELRDTGKKPSEKEIGVILGEFKGNEAFDDLEAADQLAASSEFPLVAKYFLTSGKASTAVEANKMAKEDILARSQGGKFTPFSVGTSSTSVQAGIASPITKADFDALPKGSKYVNPSDGKTYIKK